MSDSGKGQIEGAWINDTLRAVTALTDNGDEQLSILARALVVGCKSCGVDKDRTVEIVTALFDEQTTLVPFANLRTEAEAARADAVAAEREACAKIANDWLALFGALVPEHVSAQTWANDAVLDIASAIRARKAQPVALGEGEG